jgi:hypothetical protein
MMKGAENHAPSIKFIKSMEQLVGKKYGEEVAWILWESGNDNPTEEQISDALTIAREVV